jgi:hypothetical protein
VAPVARVVERDIRAFHKAAAPPVQRSVALHRQLHADVLKKRVRQLVDALPVFGAHGLASGPIE